MAKDNIPFHSIIFPSVLLAENDGTNMVYHLNSSEYLNYEGGKFSKSKQSQINSGPIGTCVWENGCCFC